MVKIAASDSGSIYIMDAENMCGVSQIVPNMPKRLQIYVICSGVARAFPGERAAHPEDQNEEENEEKLRKNERSYRKMRKD